MNSFGNGRFKSDPVGPAISMPGPKRLLLIAAFLVLLTALLSASAAAQDDPDLSIPKDAEPPPLKVISKEDRKRMDDQKNVKDRIKVSLEIMGERLLLAEERSGKAEYKEMFKDLGRFHALVDNALAYLIRNDTGNSNFLNNFKRFEMGLRGFLPRLELIRRELQPNYEYYVRRLIYAVREARQKAVDPFFDDTVIPNNNGKGNY